MKKRLLSLVLAAYMLIGTTITANAETKISEVKAHLPSSFNITIPKYISLGENGRGEFVITANGDAASDEKIVVTTDSHYILTTANGDAATANVTLDKTSMNLLTGSDVIRGEISADNLTAGEWFTSMTFLINFVKDTANKLILLKEHDVTPIPDKYNTGCQGSLTVFDENSASDFNGVNYSIMQNGELINLYLSNNDLTNTLTIRNTDFTGYEFLITNSGHLTEQAHMVFENCKFDKFRMTGYGMIDYTFNNCTFANCSGYDMTLNNCYFGGASLGDGISPKKNVTVNNSFIADLVKPASEDGQTNHIDGTQIYGVNTTSEEEGARDSENIHFKNCRFEVPYLPYTYTAGSMNCPITFTLNYGNAKNVSFEDIYVNGGTYYTMGIGADEGFEFIDVSFKNVYMGCARKSADYYGNGVDRVTMENVVPTSALYVGSVWKDSGIHLSVSNDTNVERTLKIVTNNGEYTEVIPACPVTLFLEKDSTNYEDLPFDIDISVPDADWVVAYDITNSINQIRYVNWTSNPVYVEENWDIVAPVDPEPEFVYHNVSGAITDTISYTLNEGTLTITGTGEMPDYGTAKMPPWDNYKEEIHTIIVSDGITVLGRVAFVNCTNLKTVTLGNNVVDIHALAFKNCSSLKEITLPSSLTTIGDGNFHLTSSLNTINYAGTEEQWLAITIGANNRYLTYATVNYETY